MQHTFLGLTEAESDYPRARFVVLPVPYEATTTFQTGTRHGPQAVLAASEHLEDFDEEVLDEPCRAGIATLGPLGSNADGPEAMHEDVYQAARSVVRDGKFLVALGGEHSITSGLVRAVTERHTDLSILQIDAHLDLRDSYDGSAFSHACAMRRCLDHVDRLVPVGIRNVSREEHAFVKQAGISPIFAREIARENISRDGSSGPGWIQRAIDGLGEAVYLTVDIDGFDPAYAPGTGTPEPGGLDWWQVDALVREVAIRRRIVAADVVEVMPIPGQRVTEFLAARLIYRLMARVLAGERD